MLFPAALHLLAFAGSTAAAVSTPRAPNGVCTTKLQRKAWHTFTTEEKRAYINADLCLMKIPATLGLPGTKNRFEELQSIHQTQSHIVHGVVSLVAHKILSKQTDDIPGRIPPLPPTAHVRPRAAHPQRVRVQGRPAVLG